MPKPQTSKQIDANVAASRNKEAVAKAMTVLSKMDDLARTLRGTGHSVLRNARTSVKEQMEWLIEESPIYRDAAAKLFLGGDTMTLDQWAEQNQQNYD